MSSFNPEIQSREYIGKVDEIDSGTHSGNTYIGYTDQGPVYIKRNRGVKTSNLAAGLLIDRLPIRSPDMTYQDHAVVFEGLDDYETIEEYLDRGENLDLESYIRPAGSKLLVGDSDVSYNMLVKDDTVAPIDYDGAGSILTSTTVDVFLRNYEQSHGELTSFELEEEDLRATVGDLARLIDLDDLEEEYQQYERLQDSDEAEYILMNVEKAKEW